MARPGTAAAAAGAASGVSFGQIPRIIPVLSGKGGVGKSSITVQLALSLALRGHNVGVLDVDLTGPSIPRLFGIEEAKVRQAPGGWLPVSLHPEGTVRVPGGGGAPAHRSGEGEIGDVKGHSDGRTSVEGAPAAPAEQEVENAEQPTRSGAEQGPDRVGRVEVMSLAFLLRSRNDAVIWRGPKKTAMVSQLLSDTLWSADTEILLVDTPPGTSDEHISLMTNLLDPSKYAPAGASAGAGAAHHGVQLAAVVVTTPQAIATADVKKELSFCRKVGLRVLGVVENMAGYVCPCCGEVSNVFSRGGGQVMAAEWRVGFLGSVPLDAGDGWGMLVEGGQPEPRGARVGASDSEAARSAVGDGEVQPSTEKGTVHNGETGGDRAQAQAQALVHRYARCALYPVLDAVTGDILARITGSDAVLPTPPVAAPAPSGA